MYLSSNSERYETRIVLQSPDDQETVEYAFKLKFKALNNKVLLAGL